MHTQSLPSSMHEYVYIYIYRCTSHIHEHMHIHVHIHIHIHIIMHIHIHMHIHIPLPMHIHIHIPIPMHIHKHPAGPETVPIKRTLKKKNVILPQCRANLMIGNPGKTWGAFFVFQRHRYNACVVNSWQSAFLWMHLHCQALRDLRDLSSVATCM